MMFIYAKAYVMFTEIAVTGGRPGLHEWAAIPTQTHPKPAPRRGLHVEWGLMTRFPAENGEDTPTRHPRVARDS